VTGLRVFMKRLTGLLRSRQTEREIDDEIASHLAEATDEYVARGLPRDDARLAAMRDFGGVTRTKQVHREVRAFLWPDNVRQDLKYTFRRLIKDPAFTLITITTLALGIGANTTIFALLDAVVFKPLPVPAPHELVTFYENGPEGTADATGGMGRFLRFSYPRFERLKEALGSDGSIAAVTRSSTVAVRLPGVAQTRFVQGQLVSADYFNTLDVSAARGRVLTADDVRLDRESAVAVVSDSFWKRALGATDAVIGQTIIVNDVSATVVGIMAPGFFGMWNDSEPDVWLPVTLQKALRSWNTFGTGYGRLDTNQTWLSQDLIAWLNLVARVPAANLPRVIPRLETANLQGVKELAGQLSDPEERTAMLAHTLRVEPFSRGFSGLRGRYSDALFALSALVALVLLVTCANIANLLLARGAGRAHEMSIRLSLGASTGRLVQQRLIESFTLATIGGTAGLVLGGWTSSLLAREVLGRSGQLPSVFTPDTRVLVFAAIVSLGTAIMFGLAPALRAVTVGRKTALATTQRVAVGHATSRGMRSLVVGQVALSVVIVFAALLLGRTLMNFMRIDPGFSTDRLVSASFDPVASGYTASQMPAFSQRIVESVRGLPRIISAATSMCGLLTGCSFSSTYHIEGAGEDNRLRQNWVSPEYFETVGIAVVSGREFNERDIAQSAPVAIVNESLARRFFKGENPIGRRMGSRRPNGTAPLDIEIVGVVRDAHTQTLHDVPEPLAYFPIGQWGGNLRTGVTNLDLRVDGDPSGVVSAVRHAIEQAVPNLWVRDVRTMSSRLSRDLNRERIVAYLGFSFAVLTLLLASLGLYGVLSYGVAQRTQEIGVRMALGARRIEMIGSVLGQSARLTVAGIVLGLVATSAAAGYLSNMLFGITPLDPSTFIVVSIIFAVVTTLASYVPARRATKVDPFVALRCE
jgi:predicted permease